MRIYSILLLSCLLCAGLLHAAEKDDEVVIKRNAAEQAAALNQNPGGADRGALLAARAREKIVAGLPGQRTAHPDAQWFGSASSLARSDVATLVGAHPGVIGVDVWDLAMKPESWTPTPADHAACTAFIAAAWSAS